MKKIISMSYLRYIFCISFIAYLCLFNALRVIANDLPEWKTVYVPEGEIWKYTKQHFIFNNGADPETLDPHLMTGLPEMRLAEALFEGLITYDPADLTPRPGVAESWEVSDDGLVYTFHFREYGKWSYGN